MTTATPDLIITGGTVPLISPRQDADACAVEGRPTTVAVAGERIVAVGDDDLLNSAGDRTEIIDVRGGAILPGINDGHLHFCGSAVARYVFTDISAAANWDEVAEILLATPVPSDGWIRAHGWDETTLGPNGPRTFYALLPETPVVAFDQTGHQVLLNRAALTALDLSGSVPDVAGGVVGRHADGTSNGHFSDGAMAMANERLPELPATVVRAAFARHQQDLHGYGITSLTEPGLGPGGTSLLGGACTDSALHTLVEMAAGHELTLRISALLLFNGTGGATAADTAAGLAGPLPRMVAQAGIPPEQLTVRGVKVFADGTPRSGTAWMRREYTTPCGHAHGHMTVAGETDAEREAELREIIAVIHDAGLQAGIHATGDAATASVIDAVAHAQRRRPRDARHYVIHGAFHHLDELDRLHAFGMGYSTNPAIRAGAGALMKGLLGPERFHAQQPLNSALRIGLHPNIASDAPVTSPDWRGSVSAAITRDTSAGPGSTDPERLTLSQALHLMTWTPAWQDGMEEHKGRVEPGQFADLCVLDAPLQASAGAVQDSTTTLTTVGGRVVHDRLRD